MTLVKYRPSRHKNHFDSLFNDLLRMDIGQTIGQDDVNTYSPKANIIEREKDFVLELLVPGLSKKDIEISLDENILKVASNRNAENLNETERFTRKEFKIAAFERRFTLPEEIVVDKIKADFKNGILSIQVPRSEKAQKVSRKINIS